MALCCVITLSGTDNRQHVATGYHVCALPSHLSAMLKCERCADLDAWKLLGLPHRTTSL